MTTIKNILKYIDYKGVSVNEFSKKISVSNGYFAKQKAANGAVSSNIIEKIVKEFEDINPEWLLTGNGKMLKDSGDDEYNVYDFETPAAAGSAIVQNDVDKTKVKPNLYLPDLGFGTHIRVRVKGDSMHSTIKDGDRAIGTLLNNPKDDIRSGYCYIVLDNEDGLVVKRLYRESGNRVEVVSDNEIYKPYKRELSDFISVFKVEEIHTSDLRNYYDDVRRDVRELRTEIAQIRKDFSSKK